MYEDNDEIQLRPTSSNDTTPLHPKAKKVIKLFMTFNSNSSDRILFLLLRR